ncbi:efflux RND transporter permease subunit [Phocaeicola sp.]
MDISKWAFHNRNLIYFLVAVLLLGGAFSCYQMSKLEDPEIKVKLAMVVTTYPGASAHQVELEVTDILEKNIRTMGNIDNIESYSYNDLSLIQIELLSTVPDDEVEQCWDMLRRKVSDTRVSLPEGASTPIVKDDFGNVYGMFYALTGDGLSDRELSDYAELIKREVNDLEGVDRIELYGKRAECINISLLQDRMANLGVKPAEVLATLNGQNKTTYTGYYDNGDNRIRVTVNDKFKTVEDIGKMLIQGHDDDQLRLRDIAQIEKGYETPTRNEMLYDQQRAIGILIAATSGSDIVKVGHTVDAKLAQLKADRLPAGVEYHKIFYQPERVGNSLGTFVINLIESVIIVVLILMIAMGFKSGLIIGISLVITVFGSFLFLYSAGGTMQRVSLAAFVLAMGMLVDNAIVIIDGILVDLKAGKDRMEAMTAIGRQTAMPLLGATLIAIIAFLPIYMSPDTAGVYTRDLFIVLAVSLLLSWILALMHVPLMANRRLHPAADTNNSEKRVYKGRIYAALRAALRFGLGHRWSFVFAMVALLLLSAFGYRFMRQGFFPDMVYDQLYMEYKLPEGNNYTRVEHDLAEIETYLKSRKEVTHVTASIGGTPGRYNLVRSVANPSLAYGELIIDFTSPDELVNNMDEIQSYLSKAYPDAYVKLKRYNLMFKKYPIEAQFLGPDPAVLHQLADSARAIMENTPEVCLITTDWEPQIPVLTIEYDQPAARALGLSRNDVSMSLLTATSGIPIGAFYEGIHKNNIYLKCLDEEGQPIENLGNTQVFSSIPSLNGLLSTEMMVKLQSGTLSKEDLVESIMGSTPLKQISKDVDIRWEDPVVPRYNGQRSQRVQCSPSPGIETEKARLAIAGQIEQIHLPDGYSLVWQGEKIASDKSMKYLFKNFPLAIILMIAILIMLFKDYRKPAIIFCCIPMILVGVVAVMLLTGKVFNFVAIVGTLGLIGMLIKNGIVLMDEITLQINQGIEPITALIDSSQSRLRPVMMASLTTILGMIPLLADAMFGSLAAAIMGGLLFSTLITLLFIPILYALFFHIKQTD